MAPAAPPTWRGPELKYHSRGPIPDTPSVCSLKLTVWIRPQAPRPGPPTDSRSSLAVQSSAPDTISLELSAVPVVTSSHQRLPGSRSTEMRPCHETLVPL